MGRFRRSLELAKASWAVLRQDQSLLIYPIVSAVAVVILAALIATPLFFAGAFDGDSGSNRGPVAIIAAFVLYFVCYSVIFFCNTALVSVAMLRLGGSTAPASGWAFARSRLGTILGYAAIAATVGVALRAVSEKSGVVGKIVASIGGAVWAIATFLVVPVLVVENVGPIDSVKRSASLLKRTWGEQIIGTSGIGLVTGLAALLVVLLAAGLAAIFAAIGVTPLVVLVIALAVIAIAVIAVVSSALDGIYKSALYRYASGQTSTTFPAQDLLPGAFRPK
jgi:hypothetical protein